MRLRAQMYTVSISRYDIAVKQFYQILFKKANYADEYRIMNSDEWCKRTHRRIYLSQTPTSTYRCKIFVNKYDFVWYFACILANNVLYYVYSLSTEEKTPNESHRNYQKVRHARAHRHPARVPQDA